MSSLMSVVEATWDGDLAQRMVAAAALADVADPEQWQYDHRYNLCAAPILDGDTENTISSIWAYAKTQTDRPGAAEAIVTDDHIRHAVAHVRQAAG